MALIKCPECGQEVSDTAKSCPHCGYKIRKTQNSKKTIMYAIIVVLLILGIIALTAYLVINNKKESIDNYVGQSIQDVINSGKIDKYELEEKEEASDTVEKGFIIQQFINYDEKGKNIKSITFIVSSGRAEIQENLSTIEYPNVVGKNKDDAIKMLRDEGFTSIIAKAKLDKKYEWNEVYDISPKTLTENMSYNTTITLTYNKPDLVKIPDIRGNKYTEKETAILNLGFKDYDVTYTGDKPDDEILVDILDENSNSLINTYMYTDEKIVLEYDVKEKEKTADAVAVIPTETPATPLPKTDNVQEVVQPIVQETSSSATSGYGFSSNVFCQDECGLNVEFIGVEDPAGILQPNYIAVKFMVTNNNGSDTTVLMRGFTINDCNFETSGGAANIAAGAKAIVRCTVNKDGLNEYGISSIDKLSGYYWLSVDNSYTSRFTINTR